MAIELPNNGTQIRNADLVAFQLFLDDIIIVGYGPSYGVNDATLARLRAGERVVVSPGVYLEVKSHGASAGPNMAHFNVHNISLAGPGADAFRASAEKTLNWMLRCRRCGIETRERGMRIPGESCGHPEYKFICHTCLEEVAFGRD